MKTRPGKPALAKPLSKQVRDCGLRAMKRLKRDVISQRLKWASLILVQVGIFFGLLLPHDAESLTFLALKVSLLGLAVLTIVLVLRAAFNPGTEMLEWALEQKRHDDIVKLSGSTPDELEQMLQYYLEQGNISEADKISLRLLEMVEQPDAMTNKVTGSTANVAPAAPSQVEKNRLPDWMRE